MIIDIYDYVDRYLNNYIFYHGQHFAQDVTDINDEEMANYVFGGKYQEELETAALSMQSQATMFNSDNKQAAAASLDIADAIANGTLLQETLDQIAASVNSAIDARASKIEFDKLYTAALSYQNMLSNGVPSYAAVRGFLQLLTYALDQGGGYNASFLNELRRFGRMVAGRKRFKFSGSGSPKLVSQDQLTNLTRIQKALIRAAEKFQQSGGQLSTASFRSTIAFIFKGVIADTIATNLVASAIQDGDEQVNNILIALGFKPQQGGIQKQNTNTKVNILNENGLGLSISQYGSTATIEIGTNLQVHWVDAVGGASKDNIILSKTTMGQMFQPSTPSRYYAYNLMAHRHQYPDAYNTLRGSIAANFLKEATIGHSKQQTAQFLMVDGKVYPVYSIIKNICDECMRNGGQNVAGIAIQDLSRGTNSWLTSSGITGPNIELALRRSQLVNNIIDKLIISLNFNSNMLSQYIK